MSRTDWNPRSTITVVTETIPDLFLLALAEEIRDTLTEEIVTLDLGIRDGTLLGVVRLPEGGTKGISMWVEDDPDRLWLSTDLSDEPFDLEDWEDAEEVIEAVRRRLKASGPLQSPAVQHAIGSGRMARGSSFRPSAWVSVTV